MDQEEIETAFRHIRHQVDEKKPDVYFLFAELKLKLPTYLKSLTIGQVRAAGGSVNPNIILPKSAVDALRGNYDVKGKKELLQEKLEEIKRQNQIRIKSYYNDCKRKISKNLLQKKMGELTDEEWNYIR